LDLSNNNLSDLSGTFLSKIISNCKQLEKINLNGNHLGDEALHNIADAVNKTSNLKHIDISSNEITENGAKYFTKILQKKQHNVKKKF
jgi:Ran GTPase-activating protein (RanGAP) involved in mRNA processing and transport